MTATPVEPVTDEEILINYEEGLSDEVPCQSTQGCDEVGRFRANVRGLCGCWFILCPRHLSKSHAVVKSILSSPRTTITCSRCRTEEDSSLPELSFEIVPL